MAQEQETKETKDIQAEIARPHGREQQVKMEILDMIHRGESPYDIIYHVAKWLEDVSGEPNYARYVEQQIRAVYGCALEHEERLKRIEAAFANPAFTEEEHIRIGFAIDRHKKNIERLKTLIQEAQANHTKPVIVKN